MPLTRRRFPPRADISSSFLAAVEKIVRAVVCAEAVEAPASTVPNHNAGVDAAAAAFDDEFGGEVEGARRLYTCTGGASCWTSEGAVFSASTLPNVAEDPIKAVCLIADGPDCPD